MKIVAFDPGYDEVGAACVEGNCSDMYKLINHEQIDTKLFVEKAPLQTEAEREVYRAAVIRTKVLSFLQINRPDKIGLEMPGYFTRRNEAGTQVNSPQVQKLQKGFEAVLSVCVEYKIKEGVPLTKIHEVILLHDMSIKKNRGLLARKKQAQEKALSLWGVKLKQDEADAAMIAWHYARYE